MHKEETGNAKNISYNRSKGVEYAAKKREISFLCHFTRVEAVESIDRHGLCSVNRMREKKIRFIQNDKKRLDGRTGYISCSISLPNYRLLYRYMLTYGGKWCIVLLKPEVLWEKSCLFFETNAASLQYRNEIDATFKGTGAFLKMFGDKEKRDVLSEYYKNGINNAIATDPQAEVMIEDVIQEEHILCYAVRNINDLDERITSKQVVEIPMMFEPRPDYEEWRSNGREIDLLAAI